MKKLLQLCVAIAALTLAQAAVHAAEGTAPAAPDAPAAPATTTKPEAAAPTYTIFLPVNYKVEDVATTVSRGFEKRKWVVVSIADGTVTAALTHHKTNVKATAVCTANEIKIYADSKGTAPEMTPDIVKTNVTRWLRNVEVSIRAELRNVHPRE